MERDGQTVLYSGHEPGEHIAGPSDQDLSTTIQSNDSALRSQITRDLKGTYGPAVEKIMTEIRRCYTEIEDPVASHQSPLQLNSTEDAENAVTLKRKHRSLPLHNGEHARLAKKRPRRRKSDQCMRLDMELLATAGGQDAEDQSAQVKVLMETLCNKRKIVVIAGAGISVSAGSMSLKSRICDLFSLYIRSVIGQPTISKRRRRSPY